jgi:hypothetical protein
MTIASALRAGGVGFAHLVGLASPPAPVGEPVEPVAAVAPDDEMTAMRERAEAAEARADAAESALAAASMPVDPEDVADGGADDSSEGDKKDMALPEGSRTRAARIRERNRCAALFLDPVAARNPAMAAQLAFGTDLPRDQAVTTLQKSGTAGGLSARMAGAPAAAIPTAEPGAAAPMRPAAFAIASMNLAKGK